MFETSRSASTAQAYTVFPLRCLIGLSSMNVPWIEEPSSSKNSRLAAASGSSPSVNSPFGMDHAPVSLFRQKGPPGCTISTSTLPARLRYTSSPALCFAMAVSMQTRTSQVEFRRIRQRLRRGPGSQPLNESEQLVFQMRQRILRHRTIQVVHVPVFYAVAPRRKLLFQERPMFGLFHGDDLSGCREICLRQGHGKSFAVPRRDSTFLKPRDRVARDGPQIAGIDRQSTRFGLPGEAALLGMKIKNDLGVSAAIIIARAEEENAFRRVGILVYLWFHRVSDTCVR